MAAVRPVTSPLPLPGGHTPVNHLRYPTTVTPTMDASAINSGLRLLTRRDSSALTAAIHFSPSRILHSPHYNRAVAFPSLLHHRYNNAASSSGSRPPQRVTMAAAATKMTARCPPLDLQAAKHHRLRFVRKLTTLLLSKPRQFLPLHVLSRHCRRYLTLAATPRRSVLSMVLRYPAIFRLFHAPSSSSQSLFVLSVGFTPAAAALAAEESRLREEIASSLAAKLQRLLMLTAHRRLLLSKIVHLAPDLCLPPDFRSRLCNRHPDRFRTVDTSYGRALELVAWDPALAAPLPALRAPDDDPRRPIIDRPPRFKQLKLRRGLNLKRRHRDYLIRFQELPEVSPFSPSQPGAGEAAAEKRACAVVREVLGMLVERRTLVDHLTHLRKDLGLPNKLRALLMRHPEMFYVSIKGQRDSVFLVEGYDDRGRLLDKDGLLAAKERLLALVGEGKRLRRQRRKSTAYDDDDAEEEGEGDDEEEEDGGFQDLFDSGIGDDWEELLGAGDVGVDGGDAVDWEEVEATERRVFWAVKSSPDDERLLHAAQPGDLVW
ncbi:hypothetical protein Taro_016430 [Colocasia esculenta]|uniref:PORR domain-containing protein n=1 Tax=Colocasia esculenta TaxID=4460 RepID=A0A843UNH8_COLES|nr:hypothetical protein [Colocasia esculenta]